MKTRYCVRVSLYVCVCGLSLNVIHKSASRANITVHRCGSTHNEKLIVPALSLLLLARFITFVFPAYYLRETRLL